MVIIEILGIILWAVETIILIVGACYTHRHSKDCDTETVETEYSREVITRITEDSEQSEADE